VRAVDPSLKRDAIGAVITVLAGGQTFRRECNPSSSYLAVNDLRMHVGIGAARHYDEISVLWPDGRKELFPGGEANRFLVLRKGEGNAAGSSERASGE
jgi:hypothetical protein